MKKEEMVTEVRRSLAGSSRGPRRRDWLQGAAAFAGHALWGSAAAQTGFPSSPVKLVVPFGPATGPDILGRVVGQKLAEKWAQPVVVENRSGASSMIGTKYLAAATPDGHHLLVTANTLVLNKSLRPEAPYDPVKDLQPIAPLAIGRLALVAHPSLGANNLQELVRLARAAPGAIDYGSPANGTPHHLTMELLKQSLGISLTHIPYTNTPGVVKGLIGGTVKLGFLPIHVALPHVRSGRLAMLAAGGRQRADATPEVPSLAEASGVKDIDGDIWYGMYAPVGVPADRVQRIHADVNAVLTTPEMKQLFDQQGLSVLSGSPQELADLTRKDLARWTRVVRVANLKAD
ncbi:Bug family tripartite tricarboxylate transporter substrate binding protein [Variovorax sp.]|jgi:tripartite-type tricarboxylate transporter receptor subunit TctC|uniref:Bug family tripartite tricarboxylate transporter substrate binding protein n=1 Tax=Variovorax sp. TaxID=1871043 RepID=UPI0025E8A4F5|nr:tripartite tricarboxylate transporter substrate binding protein [Variovorax sp.]